MYLERTPLGYAELVTATTVAGGLSTIVAAADWPSLTPGQRGRVDAGALLKLADLYPLTRRKRYEGIRAFAAQYGALGRLAEYRLTAPGGQSLPETLEADRPDLASTTRLGRTVKAGRVSQTRRVMGEPIARWSDAISDAWGICAYLDLLGVIDQETVPNSAERFLLSVPLIRAHVLECTDSDAECDWKIPALTRAEKREVLIAELRERVNRALGGGELRPVIVGEGFPMRLDWQPDTLRAALWLQAARLTEQSGTIRYRKCAECSAPLVFTGDRQTGIRAGSEYCSSACTQRGYRKRQARARALHQKGWTIDEIAAELKLVTHKGQSAHNAVKGWLKPRESRGRRSNGTSAKRA